MSQFQLLPYKEFARLSLDQFLAGEPIPRRDIALLENWEFMGGVWNGRAIGFSKFLSLETWPEELGSIAVDTHALPDRVVSSIFKTLRLPVVAGMSVSTIESLFGSPRKKLSFVADRFTYEYVLGDVELYRVSFTIRESIGLSYVVVIRGDLLALCNIEA